MYIYIIHVNYIYIYICIHTHYKRRQQIQQFFQFFPAAAMTHHPHGLWAKRGIAGVELRRHI